MDAREPVRAAVIAELGRPPSVGVMDVGPVEPGRCLIQVRAAPISPLDLLCASGTSYFGTPAVPYVPGVQGVGVVVDGAAFDVGSRVWFGTDAGQRPGNGSLAEYAVVDEQDVVPLTADVDDSEAAALGLSSVAAWMCLTWKARLQAGESVLVLGCGGAVGQVAVQAAVALGAGAVVGASRRAVGRDRALAAGASDVVDLAGADVESLTERIRAAAGAPFDVVIDPICGDTTTAALRALADGGRLVHLGGSGGPTATFSSATLRSGSHEILGYTNNSISPAQRSEALGRVHELAAQGRCHVEHEVIDLADVAAGWQRTAAAHDARIVVAFEHAQP
jgi:NADPH:quinone reductase-like Zn-dependent oxidoreductase